MKMKISDIKIGTRFRKNLGDLDSLARSIHEIGLIHPPTVNENNELIAGYRRIEACKSLEWKEIPVVKLNLNDILRGECDENTLRKDFTAEERVAIGEALEEREREKAKERMIGKGVAKKKGEKISTEKFAEDKGRALEKVARVVGWSRPTYEKAKTIIDAIEDAPEKYGDLKEKIDKSVDSTFIELKLRQKKEDLNKKAKSLPKPKPHINDVFCGDAIKVMKKIPDHSVHFVMFSPAYYGLRDYGMEGQIGLEDDPSDYIEHLVDIGREIKRVLRRDGSWYLNIGDVYGGSGGGSGQYKPSPHGFQFAPKIGWSASKKPPQQQLLAKCKLLMPYRVALALEDDGWICRNDIIWAKQVLFENDRSFGHSIPSSVDDRLTNNFEPVFHFTQQEDYYYDLEAIRVPYAESSFERSKYPTNKFSGNPDAQKAKLAKGMKGGSNQTLVGPHPMGKNPGDVWHISTRSNPYPHYASYPVMLCKRPILSSCPERVCVKCGAPYKRVFDIEKADTSGSSSRTLTGLSRFRPHKSNPSSGEREGSQKGIVSKSYVQTGKFIGWIPTCDCNAGTKPGVVLDPMCGTGTTLVAAKLLMRDFIGIDINPEYIEICRDRLSKTKFGGGIE